MDDELKLYDTDPAAWTDQQADALRAACWRAPTSRPRDGDGRNRAD